MRRRSRHQRGFTLIELAIVVAIIGVVAALAWNGLGGARKRSSFSGVVNDLQALLHQARQQAIASGNDVVVAVFPANPNPGGSLGRVVVFQDPSGSFFSAAGALNLDNYAPATPGYTLPAPTNASQIGVTVLDLPRGITFAPPPPTLVMQPPFTAVPVAAACSFCGATRGGLRFDARGRAFFFSAAGVSPAVVTGQSLTLWNADVREEPLLPSVGYRTLVITSATGNVLTFNNG